MNDDDLTFREVLAAHFQRYTLAYFLAGCYFLVASLGAFTKLFGELTPEKWAAMGWWQVWAAVADCVLPGVVAVLAFLNNTKAKIDLKVEEEKAKEPAPVRRLPPLDPDEAFAKLDELPPSSKL